MDLAVQCARTAFKKVWKYNGGDERNTLLFNLAALIERDIEYETYPNIEIAIRTIPVLCWMGRQNRWQNH